MGYPSGGRRAEKQTLLFRSFSISPQQPSGTEDEVVVYTDLFHYLLCNQRTDFANQLCLTAARGGFCGSLCFLSYPAA